MPNKNQVDELKVILFERKENILSNISNSRANIDQLKEQEINDELDYAELVSDSFTEGMIANHQLDELKIILLERKENILSNINNSRANIDQLKEQEINDELDYAELVSDSFTEGMIANHQIDELKQIEESLKKIDAGTYGICDMCGVVIPLGRLKAKPFAKFCTECRTVYENEFVKRAKN